MVRFLRDFYVYCWRMLNVVKCFGVLRRDVKIRRVEWFFEGMVIEREILNEFYYDKVDVKMVELVMEMFKVGSFRVKIVFRKEFFIFVRLNMIVGGEFFLSGIFERDEVFELFKKRFFEYEVVLVCINCGWYLKIKVVCLRSIKERECFCCGLKMLVVVYLIDVEEFLLVFDKVRYGRLFEKKEEWVYRKLLKVVDFVDFYGFDVVLVFVSYGIGLDIVVRILS